MQKTITNLSGDALQEADGLISEYPVVSLFSGGMGLDLGMVEAGLDVRVGQDYDPSCVKTIKRNGHVIVPGDIRQLMANDPSCNFLLDAGRLKRDDLFAIVGGPPCQAYSTAGKRLGVDDARGGLYTQFGQAVDRLRPRFFVFENVKGLTSTLSVPEDESSPLLLEVIVEMFRSMGYHVVYGIADAVNYGTPQFRERVLIIGSRDNEQVFLPTPTHFQIHQVSSMRWMTLRDAISHLQADPGPCAKFSPRAMETLRIVPEGGNWKSLPADVAAAAMGGGYTSTGGRVGFFRKLRYDEPSPTLVTSPVQRATMLCHPTEMRPLSVREYAAIQQFPDWWSIEGSLSDCYRQIGNAVPVALGRAIGQMLRAVASGAAEVRVKRAKGASAQDEMSRMFSALHGKRA
jgi:DNA (cytosine-5)-methyltransferase 1